MAMRESMLAGFLALSVWAPVPALHAEGQELATEEARTLYALGLSIAESVSRFQLTESELELVARGFADGVLNRPADIQPRQYSSKINELANARLDRAFREQERIGAAFRSKALAEHRDAVMTPSKAIAIPLRTGTGAVAVASDTVRIAYKGSLIDGTVFGRTQPGESLTVGVSDAAIPCLSEGLLRMRPGSAQRLVCPPERDFFHPKVRTGSTLIYDLELLEVLAPELGGLR